MFDGLDNAYPLTPVQQGMLYEVLNNPNSDIYIAYIAIDITGKFDPGVLRLAWERTALQHETLRTRFLWEELDEPMQLVNSVADIDWTQCEAAPGNGSDYHAIVDYWIKFERQSGLELKSKPPMRLRLIRVNDELSVLIWVVHHLLADDWSTPLVLTSVANHYQAIARSESKSIDEPAAPGFEYVSYVDWLTTMDRQQLLDYWRPILADFTPTHIIDSTLSHSVNNKNSEKSPTPNSHTHHKTQLTESQSHAIDAACSRYGVTLSTLMHVAWGLVLSRFTGHEKVVFGTSVSGRSCPLEDIDQAVGLFLNTQPTPLDTRWSGNVAAFCQHIQKQLFAQLVNEHLPLAELQRLIPSSGSNSLFDTVLVVESHGPELSVDVKQSDIRFNNIRYYTDSNYPLTVLVFPGAQLHLHLVFDASLLDQEFIGVLTNEFVSVLVDLSNPSFSQIAQLQERICSRARMSYPLALPTAQNPHTLVDQWIDSYVHSGTLAVIDGGVSHTYAQLLSQAQSLAHAILQATNNDENYIGVYLPSGIAQITSLVAVLKSAKAYVPLEPDWPASRVAAVLSDAQITTVITSKDQAKDFPSEIQMIVLEDALRDVPSDLPTTPLAELSRSEFDPAYMLFTSGSTGRAKGVSVSHKNLISSTQARIDYYPNQPERFLLLSSFAFDSSVAGIFWTLCTGGTLVLPQSQSSRDIHELESLIESHKVTHTLCLPSLYSLLLRYADVETLCRFNTIIVAGEACPPSLVEQHCQKLPVTGLYNEYGPTEATVWSTVSKLNKLQLSESGGEKTNTQTMARQSIVSIGVPIPGTRVEIIDKQGRVCPPGVIGEIAINGPGVTSGYYTDTDLSARRFRVEAPSNTYFSGDLAALGTDGEFYFMGRRDGQLKVRGHRIEVGEIESRVEQHADVLQAVCALQPTSDQADAQPINQQLVCYFTCEKPTVQDAVIAARHDALSTEQSASRAKDIQSFAQNIIAEQLPDYFSIACYVELAEIPHLPNGKIDFSALKNPFLSKASTNRTHTVDTGTESVNNSVSNRLCSILAQILGRQTVSVHDNFFALGGDSLSAIRFVAAAREAGLMITVPLVSGSESILGLSTSLEVSAALCDGSVSSREWHDASGDAPLTPIQRWFFSLRQAQPECWNMACVVPIQASIPSASICNAITTTVAEQRVLGAQFIMQDGSWIQHIPQSFDASNLIRQRVGPDNREDIASELAQMQTEFDLATGQLIRFLVVLDNNDKCVHLAWVAHHLITDAISNWHLAEQILTIANQAVDTPAKSPQPHPYRDWALLVAQNTPSQGLISDHPPNQVWLECDVEVSSVSLGPITSRALTAFCQKHALRQPIVVLYALLVSAKTAIATNKMRVDVETHGRDLMAGEVDISNTIGWFSHFFTLWESDLGIATTANFKALCDFALVFEHSKEQQQQLFPEQVNRLCDTEEPASDCLTFLYNYLAFASTYDDSLQFDAPIAEASNSTHSLEHLIDSRFRSPHSKRSHGLEVQVAGNKNDLLIHWQVDKNHMVLHRLAQWQSQFVETLKSFSAEHAQPGFTEDESLSLVDSGMDAAELDQFLIGLE